jgi:hypothetical protein
VAQISILLIFSDQIIRGFREPFFSRLINEHLDAKNRATTISIQRAAISFIVAFFLAGFGILLKYMSLPSAMQILGIFIFVVGLLMAVLYRRSMA